TPQTPSYFLDCRAALHAKRGGSRRILLLADLFEENRSAPRSARARDRNAPPARPIAWYLKRAAAPPRSSRTPKPIANRPSPKPRAKPRASAKSTNNTRRRRT